MSYDISYDNVCEFGPRRLSGMVIEIFSLEDNGVATSAYPLLHTV